MFMNSAIFGALAEPNRLNIIEFLRNKPASVGEIAKKLLLSQPLVSSHLKVLSKAGLIKMRPVAQKRIYQLQARPFEDLGSWTATFRKVWQRRFDEFESQLEIDKNLN